MKIIKTGNIARDALKRGIDTVANCVKYTLGPSGRTAILGRKFLPPVTCDDGVSLSAAIMVEDEVEQLGVQLGQEVGRITERKVKDFTSTSTVLLQAIVDAGIDRLSSGSALIQKVADPIDIKDEIMATLPKVCEALDKMSTPVKTIEDMEKIAYTSSKDKRISKIVSEVFSKIGKDGVVTIEDGDFDVESEIIDGFEIQSGFHSPHMANTPNGELVMLNPLVLVTNQPIDKSDQLSGILPQMLAEKRTDLVVIAPSFTPDILREFTQLKYGISAKVKDVVMNISMNILAIKPPFFASKERFEDISLKLGGVFFDSDRGLMAAGAQMKDLGSAKKVIADKNRCVIFGGNGDSKARLIFLKEELKKTKGALDKEKLQTRIASLSNGVGIIRVGADTDTERENLKHEVQDAVGSTRNALVGGYVPGAGQALKSAVEELELSILTEPLKSIYKQIQFNAGGKLKINKDVIDATEGLKTALKNACEIASNVITTEIAVAEKNEPNPKQNLGDSRGV